PPARSPGTPRRNPTRPPTSRAPGRSTRAGGVLRGQEESASCGRERTEGRDAERVPALIVVSGRSPRVSGRMGTSEPSGAGHQPSDAWEAATRAASAAGVELPALPDLADCR